MPEEQLEEQWRPDGRRRRTPEPATAIENGFLTIRSSTPGVILGWTTEAPTEQRSVEGTPGAFGSSSSDPRRWRPYSGPVPVEAPVRVKAWRLGYEPSKELLVEAASAHTVAL